VDVLSRVWGGSSCLAGEIAALGGVHVAGGDDVVAAVHRLGEDDQQVTACVGGAVDEPDPFTACLGQAWSGVDGLFYFGGCHLVASPDVIFRLVAPTNLSHTHNIIQRITNGLWQGYGGPFPGSPAFPLRQVRSMSGVQLVAVSASHSIPMLKGSRRQAALPCAASAQAQPVEGK